MNTLTTQEWRANMAPLVYNKLPNNVKELLLTKFRKHVTELLLRNYYYSVQKFLDDK